MLNTKKHAGGCCLFCDPQGDTASPAIGPGGTMEVSPALEILRSPRGSGTFPGRQPALPCTGHLGPGGQCPDIGILV